MITIVRMEVIYGVLKKCFNAIGMLAKIRKQKNKTTFFTYRRIRHESFFLAL